MSEYALRLQNSQDTAARVRLGDLLGLTPAGPLTGRTGIRPAPTAGDVAAVAGTMNVSVQPFVAWVQGGVSTAQGGYPFVLDAAKTLALANGHASLSRTDVIAVVVKDDAYDGSGLFTATVTVVQGTPGAGTPSLPVNALPLRNVTVPANLSVGTGGLTAGNLSTDRRTYVAGLGGVVTVATQAERDALPATLGTVVYRTDTDVFEVRRSTGWEQVQTTASLAWTAPTLTNGWVNFGSPYRVAGYRKVGRMVQLRGLVKSGTLGAQVFLLPSGFRPAETELFATDVNAITHGQVSVGSNGAVLGSAATGGTNAYLSLSGIQFEADGS